MLKDLKATREQRIKRLEDSNKHSLVGKEPMSNPDVRRQIGTDMEKFSNGRERIDYQNTINMKTVM